MTPESIRPDGEANLRHMLMMDTPNKKGQYLRTLSLSNFHAIVEASKCPVKPESLAKTWKLAAPTTNNILKHHGYIPAAAGSGANWKRPNFLEHSLEKAREKTPIKVTIGSDDETFIQFTSLKKIGEFLHQTRQLALNLNADPVRVDKKIQKLQEEILSGLMIATGSQKNNVET